MALSAKLQMRQAQTLAMTPQLLQSIRLLQYSNLELRGFIDQEIERNPLLAHARPSTGGAAESGAPAPKARPKPAGPVATGRASGEPGLDSGIENIAERRPSLQAHARAEIGEALVREADRELAWRMADHLDENGYLAATPGEIALENGVSCERVERVLAALKAEIVPAGLFARDLADCLATQLRRADRFDPVMAAVIANLDALARRDFAALRRLTGEDDAGLMDIFAEIRRLDPKPGLAFAHAPPEPVTPDVLVTAAAAGGWAVDLNPEALPAVLVDQAYLERVRANGLSRDDRSFIGECQQSANWLVRSLEQRARTIAKVAAEIVRQQDGFLARGIDGLRPMTLMAVAEAIGMHESTVSRVTAGKYMATPRGTFEMRSFFTVAIAAADGGDAHSAERVKHRIKTLIDAESPGQVLSDDEIAARLKSEGVDLARRTVAKYREAQGLPSSVRRRRELNARALAS